MKKTAIALSCLLVLAIAPQARAASVYVSVADDTFASASVVVGVGGTVSWKRAAGSTGEHNVRENSKIFYSGVASTHNPASGGFIVKFSAGMFHYYCEMHGSPSGQMAGYVRVPPNVSEAPSGLPFTVRWSTSGVNTGSRYDVQYKMWWGGSTVNWLLNTPSYSGIFGASNRPAAVHDNANYYFRARTRKIVGSTTLYSSFGPWKLFTP